MASRKPGKYTLTLSSNILDGDGDSVRLLLPRDAQDFIFDEAPDDEKIARAVMEFVMGIDERSLVSMSSDHEVAIIPPNWLKSDSEFWGYEVKIEIHRKEGSDYFAQRG